MKPVDFAPDKTISGKRLLPGLVVGCLLFSVIMGFGTYFVAQAVTPYLKKKNSDYLKTHKAPEAVPSPPATPGTTR
jgi:hypothetical protein